MGTPRLLYITKFYDRLRFVWFLDSQVRWFDFFLEFWSIFYVFEIDKKFNFVGCILHHPVGFPRFVIVHHVSRVCNSLFVLWITLKLHSHQTADKPPLNADQFLWLGRVWSGKKLPALIEERIYPRSTPAVSALYPWCTHAQIPLFPTYTRPSNWPIPALYDQPPTYSWWNYAHCAQYRTNPRSQW